MKFSRTKTKTDSYVSLQSKKRKYDLGVNLFCLPTDEFSEVLYALNIRECKDD